MRRTRTDYVISNIIVTGTISILLQSDIAVSPTAPIVFILIVIGALVHIYLAIGRLKDMNTSPWWSVLIIFPLVGLIFELILIIRGGTIGPNKYGEDPRPTI